MSSNSDWSKTEGAQHWLAETQIYGKSLYVRGVLDILKKIKPSKVFELGIGNGYPFTTDLHDAGVQVEGCDISLLLLEDLNKRCPSIRWFHTGYEDMLEKIKTEQYDICYCVRSSWYFSDVYCAINHMLQLVKSKGFVCIDIMNRDTLNNYWFLWSNKYKKYKKIFKNIVKKILERLFGRVGKYEDVSSAKHYPVSARRLEAWLRKKNLACRRYTYDQIVGASTVFDPKNFRMFYIIEKRKGDNYSL